MRPILFAKAAALASALALTTAWAADGTNELKPGRYSGLAFFYIDKDEAWFWISRAPDADDCNQSREGFVEYFVFDKKQANSWPSPCFEVDIDVAAKRPAYEDAQPQPEDAIRGWAVNLIEPGRTATGYTVIGATSDELCRAAARAGKGYSACRPVVVKISAKLTSKLWIYLEPSGSDVRVSVYDSRWLCESQRKDALAISAIVAGRKPSYPLRRSSPCLPVRIDEGHAGTLMQAWVKYYSSGGVYGALSESGCLPGPCEAVSISRP
jgi:hypothetical protein